MTEAAEITQPLDPADRGLLDAILGASEAELYEQRFHPYANIFPLMPQAESDELGASMAENGQREKIVLLDGMVLDGRNRAIQARKRNLTLHIRHFDIEREGDPLKFVIDLNLRRRQLNESQRAMVAARIANVTHGGARGGEQAASLPLDLAPVAPVTQEQAAETLNVSERSVRRAAAVQQDGVQDLQAVVEQGEIKVSTAAEVATLPKQEQEQLLANLPRDDRGSLTEDAKKLVLKAAKEIRAAKQQQKKERRHERERELGQRMLAEPEVKVGFILADPEWKFRPYSEETGMDRNAANHYPVSPDPEIHRRRALIDRIAAEDSVCGLWCTDFDRGVDTMRAWGYEPKSYRIWVKDIIEVVLPDRLRQVIDSDADGIERADRDEGRLTLADRRLLMVVGAPGMGFWKRDRCEIFLIGVRGKPVCPAMGEQGESVWFARRGEHAVTRDDVHSDKPECSYEWIEEHFPNTPKIELNARRARPGWLAWGNEAEGSFAVAGDAAPPPDVAPIEGACCSRDEVVSNGPLRAADVRAQVDEPIYFGEHQMVTAQSHPRLHMAFETISHDSGAGAGHAQYPVPLPAATLEAAEAALETLDDDELETFCIGDQDDAQDLIAQCPELAEVHTMLNEFFEGFVTADVTQSPPAGEPAASMES